MKRIITLLLCAAMLLSLGMISSSAEFEMGVGITDEGFIVEVSGEFGEKDWIGLYKVGEQYGTGDGCVASIIWWYVNEISGDLSFPEDVSKVYQNRLGDLVQDGEIVPGEYVLYCFVDDGYELLNEYAYCQFDIHEQDYKLAIDYDASSFAGSEFQQIYWNGAKFNNYEVGESPLTALKTVLTNGEYVDDRGGNGKSLGLEGWVGFDQNIEAFGVMINNDIIWDDAFSLGTDNAIKAEDKGGQYAEYYRVTADISRQYGEYTVGVVAALADGTIVKLNSSNEELNTFISFAGPEEPSPVVTGTATTEPIATADNPVTDVPATDIPATEVPATDAPVVTNVPATDVPATDAATDVPATEANATGGETKDNNSSGLSAGAIIGIIAGAVVVIGAVAAAVVIGRKKKK